MRKLLKHRKAMSPVIAAIILIAVTVAVSIAVAAWMGALTIGFMGGAEQLKIIEVRFVPDTTKKMTVEMVNTGASVVTIQELRVDGVAQTTNLAGTGFGGTGAAGDPFTLAKGTSGILTVDFDWTAGASYEVTVKTANNIYPVPARAPS